MEFLFNDNWLFAKLPLDEKLMYKNNKPVPLEPQDFYNQAQNLNYSPVTLPHDWLIENVNNLYESSVGFYQKTFLFDEKNMTVDLSPCHKVVSTSSTTATNEHFAIKFGAVYMNSSVWLNGEKIFDWKYGYTTFETDISNYIKPGENLIQVIAVYQNCNTRWYSGAGIIRDVTFIQTPKIYIPSDGTYIHTEKADENNWLIKIETEIKENPKNCKLKTELFDKNKQSVTQITTNAETLTKQELKINSPKLWSPENPELYTIVITLLDNKNNILQQINQNCGFKDIVFDSNNGFFLNGKNYKLKGVCQHHDLGALGAAFNIEALKRQFFKLKQMGVNAIRCSHNPPAEQFLDLADKMGFLIADEAFDMWELNKTPFDYANYFNQWYKKDVESWVKRDRNHPCVFMWSIGNEIYDTHAGNGYEITKKLYDQVIKHDPLKNGLITIASNYMMTSGGQECAKLIDAVGYNYSERLYHEHHQKYPEWKIYGSETASTIQSRGIYHFPESLKLVTFSDGQCSCLGNCTTTWGAPDTQTVITKDRDIPFSAGQFIWTGWDYIGEPTPYHSKNSFFGQIDTAGFEKDTFYLYKSEWGENNFEPFVHLLPYWDWNENQIIDVKAYTNAPQIELFIKNQNEKDFRSLGLQKIDHKNSTKPFGQWQLPYHKGEIKAVAYDLHGNILAQDEKKSFDDPKRIIITPENYDNTPKENPQSLFFLDLMTVDSNNIPVENARNYITVEVTGNAKLIGMDNGDSTDYDEYISKNQKNHSRKLFSNRALAIIKAENYEKAEFTVTATSKDLEPAVICYKNGKWLNNCDDKSSLCPKKDYVPVRKIELSIEEGKSPLLTKENNQITVTAKIFPENATNKEIKWTSVLKECVPSDFISIEKITGKNTGTESAVIKAFCDGECILRCTANNNSQLTEVISDLNISIKNVGNPMLNPYKLIEACRFSNWQQDKEKPVISLEGGISNNGIGSVWISFDKVDFGTDGADTIHLPIFSFETQLPIEVWDGQMKEQLGSFIYNHESVYNTYNENIFTLNRRLFGVHTISILLPHELVFQGFYFDKTPKAFAKLRALDADFITGDTFTKTKTCVTNIGNNVTLDFNNMDFTSKNEQLTLTICGKSNIGKNTINIKFTTKEGLSFSHSIDFFQSKDFIQNTYNLPSFTGKGTLSFIFLPGSNFDFEWFWVR